MSGMSMGSTSVGSMGPSSTGAGPAMVEPWWRGALTGAGLARFLAAIAFEVAGLAWLTRARRRRRLA